MELQLRAELLRRKSNRRRLLRYSLSVRSSAQLQLQLQLQLPVLRMELRSTSVELWPTQVSFFETPVDWAVNRQLADEAIAAAGIGDSGARVSAGKRRVRGILERSGVGHALKAHLFACARAVLGPWAQYLDPDHCENRALVIEPGGFISTHKDSREGDLTCVHFLTGSNV